MGARRVNWGTAQFGAVLDDALVRALVEDLGTDPVAALVGLFVDDAPARIDALRALVEAGDGIQAAKVAHALKSSSSSVGALAFAARCGHVQQLAAGGQLDQAGGQARLLAGDLVAAHQALTTVLGADGGPGR